MNVFMYHGTFFRILFNFTCYNVDGNMFIFNTISNQLRKFGQNIYLHSKLQIHATEKL